MTFTEPYLILAHIGAFALCISLAFTGFMISAGLIDVPVERSSHANPTPTAGGIGIMAGIGAGLLALALYYPVFGSHGTLGTLAALIFAVGLLGFLDDVHDLDPKLKFVIMDVIAGVAVYVIGPPTGFPYIGGELPLPYWLAYSGTVLWIFTLLNAVNFIDGANGLMGMVMFVACLFLCVISVVCGASDAAILSALTAAGILGFLPYNAKYKANIFAGDVGSLVLGFTFAIAALLLVSERPSLGLLYVGPMLLLPLLADILLTMAVRVSRKENLLTAHRLHIFQRMIKAGHSHRQVALKYGLMFVIVDGLVLLMLPTPYIRSPLVLFGLAAILSIGYWLLKRKYPR